MILIWLKNFHNLFLEWEFGKPFKNGTHKDSKPKVSLDKNWYRENIHKIATTVPKISQIRLP